MVEYRILTTENVPFTYRVAGIGPRFLAWCLDQMALAVILFAGLGVGIGIDSITQQEGFGQSVIFIWVPFSRLGYFILCEWLWLGQTVGKRILGIRAIQLQGTALGFRQALLRNVLRLVDMLPFAYGVGVAVSCTNRLSRRLGDLAANTLVVHVDQKGAPLHAIQEHAAAVLPEREVLWRERLRSLSKEQKQTLIDVCLRREQLGLKSRASLFAALSQHLQCRLQLAKEEHQSDERFIQQAAALLTSSSLRPLGERGRG